METTGSVTDTPEKREDLYTCYCRFVEESTNRMISLMTSEDRRERLRQTQKPLSREEFEKRFAHMDPHRKEAFERRMREGYEAQRVHMQPIVKKIIETIKRRMSQENNNEEE